MKIAIYAVATLLFTLWIIIVVRDMKKLKEIREIKGFENVSNYYDVKRIVKNNQTDANLETLAKLKSFKNRTLLFWFLSLFTAVIILLTVGILTRS